MVWAGIDPGERRIGLARSDPLHLVAHPFEIVDSEKELIETLQGWEDDPGLSGVVVGMPRNMNGSYGVMARRAYRLIQRLRQALGVPVRPWDERWTTQQVERTRSGGGRGDPVDHRVAALILQSFLDAGRPEVSDPDELKSGEGEPQAPHPRPGE